MTCNLRNCNFGNLYECDFGKKHVNIIIKGMIVQNYTHYFDAQLEKIPTVRTV